MAIEYVRASEIPRCTHCGDLCDRETATGRWYHTKCEPKTLERRERTLRVLRIRDEILRREGRES